MLNADLVNRTSAGYAALLQPARTPSSVIYQSIGGGINLVRLVMRSNLAKYHRVISIGLLSAMLNGCGGGDNGDSDSPPISATPPTNQTEMTLTLLWDPPPAGEQVLGYLVYFGTTPESVYQLLSTLHDGSDVDTKAPQVTYRSATQLGLRSGDNACFRVKAFNARVESDFSNTACTTIR